LLLVPVLPLATSVCRLARPQPVLAALLILPLAWALLLVVRSIFAVVAAAAPPVGLLPLVLPTVAAVVAVAPCQYRRVLLALDPVARFR
jgi:hypothetical protein